MTKPLIGIVAREMPGETQPVYSTNARYVTQVERAGGIPLLLPMTPGTDAAQLAAALGCVQGLLLPGGGDLDPGFYGQRRLQGERTNFYQDLTDAAVRSQEAELALIRQAGAAGLPMLGICLGIQSLNVAFGGTLVQDIPQQLPQAVCHAQEQRAAEGRTTHPVLLEPDSLTAKVCGSTAFAVNSYHHQSVQQAAPGFRVVGRAPDGVIEAIEAPERDCIGVQWHPEWLTDTCPEALPLFRWLVERAARRADGRTQ